MPRPPPTARQAKASEWLRRVTDAENALAEAREALKELCLEAPVKEREAFSVNDAFMKGDSPIASTPINGGNVARMQGSPFSTAPVNPENGTSLQRVIKPILKGESYPFVEGEDREETPLKHTPSSASIKRIASDNMDENERIMVQQFAKRLKMEESDVEKCYRCFLQADSDGSGNVDVSEMKRLLSEVCHMEIDQDDVDKLLVQFDTNHDHLLNLEEFLHAYNATPLQQAVRLEAEINAMGDQQRMAFERAELTADQKIETVGVPKKFLMEYLGKEIKEAKACIQIPIAILLFCLFLLAALFHLNMERLHAVENAIVFDIEHNANFAFSGAIPFDNGRMGHKTMSDINSFADFWSWMNLGLVPLLFTDGNWSLNEAIVNADARCATAKEALFNMGWETHWLHNLTDSTAGRFSCPPRDKTQAPDEFYGSPRTPTYLFYNSMVGGVRLRQERMEHVSCPGQDDGVWMAVHSGKCVPGLKYWLKPEAWEGMTTDEDLVNLPGGETQFLLSGTRQRDVLVQLRDLENAAWFDPQTSKIEIAFVTYNAHQDILAITFINIFMSQSGHIFKHIEPVAIWLHPYHGWMNYFLDAAWCATVFHLFFTELRQLVHSWRIMGFVQGTCFYMRPSNVVDWAVVAYSVAIIVMFHNHIMDLQQCKDLLKEASVDVIGSWTDEQDRIDFFDLVYRVSRGFTYFQRILGMYPLVIALRYFKAFNAQPRLAMVTRTLRNASVDLIHYGVVFFSIFCVFAAAAQILFGLDHTDFATYARSMTSVFRILLGDFDWDMLREGGRTQAVVWFWSFMWLVNIVMMNILLAVVMDVFTEVKNKSLSTSAETLWSQSYEMFVRWRQVRTGKYLSFQRILEVLQPNHMAHSPGNARKVNLLKKLGSGMSWSTNISSTTSLDEPITVETFMDQVRGLSHDQAKEILLSALDEYGASNQPDDRLPEKLKKINLRLKHVVTAQDKLLHMNNMMSKLIVRVGHAARPKRKLATNMSRQLTPAEDDNPWEASPSKLQVSPVSSTLLHLETLLKSCVEDLSQTQAESCTRMEAVVLRLAEILQKTSGPLPFNSLPTPKGSKSGGWPFNGCAPAMSTNQIVREK